MHVIPSPAEGVIEANQTVDGARARPEAFGGAGTKASAESSPPSRRDGQRIMRSIAELVERLAAEVAGTPAGRAPLLQS